MGSTVSDAFVRIIKAEKLRVGDIVSSDPYVIGTFVFPDRSFSNSVGFRTRTIHNTLTPFYDDDIEVWEFGNIPPKSELRFVIRDRDQGLEEDDLLGECAVTFPVTTDNSEMTLPVIWNGGQRGTLTVRITTRQSSAIRQGPPTRRGRLHYTRFDSISMGLITASKADFATNRLGIAFSFWEVELNKVDDFDVALRVYPWNKSYPPGQKIYADTPSARLIRGMVHREHIGLYHRRGDQLSQRGLIANGDEFLRIFNYGKRQNISRVFTYVVVDAPNDGGPFLRFSETGSSFTKDFASKHAVHANAATDVRVAGEFIVIGGQDGEGYTLVLDNASGTFGPDLDGVLRLAKNLETNLPGLKVAAYAFDDPNLTAMKKPIADQSNGLAK
ncbi:hypothetical protein HDU93_004348 [Gonapodya sp. JEL0774]|nr:hypothetical protein HDU93_004348 [Gonapodya sp. JEL0774]